MREIKFRAWDKARKRFAPWIEICADGSFIRGEIEDSYSGLIPWEDGEAILMQYTGLKDKNGKEIYEGDIIESKELKSHGERDEDVHVESYRSIVDFIPPEFTGVDPDGEIIGNIYENGNLLNGK